MVHGISPVVHSTSCSVTHEYETHLFVAPVCNYAQVQEVILTELHSSLVSQRHGVKSLTKKLAPQASFTL
eukprot:scaffold124331_cov21-Tisochrysis_lutea.AAC.2